MRIINAKLLAPSGWIERASMDVADDGTIAAIGLNLGISDSGITIDAKGRMIVPGFIDLHVHGGGGFDAMSGEPEQLAGMSRYHAANGTTSFLATTVTAPEKEIVRALCTVKRVMQEAPHLKFEGAELLGVHVEGPFLNPERAGAQNPAYLRLPAITEWERYVDAAGAGCIRLLTIAPELSGAEAVIKAAISAGVTVSIGHSDADYDTVRVAVEWGCRHITHMFNGMRPLHHRDPGVAGGAFLLDDLTVELIADGVHVHPDLVSWMFRIKPDGKVILITDCVAIGGCPDGDYELEGLPLRMEGGRIYVCTPEGGQGSLAGSSLTTMTALRNAAGFTGKPPEELLEALTLNPARQIGMESRKGSLEIGKDADFLILSDGWQLEQTYVRGQRVYDRKLND